MKLGWGFWGPERETFPAFCYPVTRDFDGGLLRRWTFVLTRADALAVLRLPGKLSARVRIGVGLACFASGALSTLLPWGGIGPILATESVLLGGLYAGRDMWRRLQAARLVPLPRPGMFEEWVDCIAGSEIDSPDEAYLSPELIGQVLLTRTHLFIRNSTTTIVVPRHAFANADEAKEIATYITRLSRGPYYFDAPLDDASPGR